MRTLAPCPEMKLIRFMKRIFNHMPWGSLKTEAHWFHFQDFIALWSAFAGHTMCTLACSKGATPHACCLVEIGQTKLPPHMACLENNENQRTVPLCCSCDQAGATCWWVLWGPKHGSIWGGSPNGMVSVQAVEADQQNQLFTAFFQGVPRWSACLYTFFILFNQHDLKMFWSDCTKVLLGLNYMCLGLWAASPRWLQKGKHTGTWRPITAELFVLGWLMLRCSMLCSRLCLKILYWHPACLALRSSQI